MKNDDEKFSDLDFLSKLITISCIGFLIIIALLFVIAIYFFGITVFFRLLNVHYDSNQVLLSFILNYLFICLIAELFAKLIVHFFIIYVNHKVAISVIPFLFDFFISWIILHFLDESTSGITIPTWVELLLAFVVACADISFDRKKE